MKKILALSIVLFLMIYFVQAQDKIVGEKRGGSEGVIGEKRPGDAAITKNKAQVETAFMEYTRQREEMEKRLAALHLQIEEGIRLLEKYRRFKSPKQGIRLRNSWKEALKLQEKANGEIKVVKSSVVAPDMIQ